VRQSNEKIKAHWDNTIEQLLRCSLRAFFKTITSHSEYCCFCHISLYCISIIEVHQAKIQHTTYEIERKFRNI